MRFSFTGELVFNNLESPNPYIREGKTKSGATYKSLNLSVVAAKNNRAFCEMFGMERETLHLIHTDGSSFEVDWDERDSAIGEVSNMRKFVMTVDGERNEFITELDFINFISNNLELFKGKKFTVTGDVNKDFYNGKCRDRFQIRNIFEADEDRKNALRITGKFFFNKDSFDYADWKTDHTLSISGYVSQYINKDEGTKYVDQSVTFDASKIKWDNPTHVARTNYKLKQMKAEATETSFKTSSSSQKMYSIPIICNYVNGAEEVEFDENLLTPNQKEAIELGLKTLNDFRPKGSTYGDRVTLLKLIDFDLRDDYADGCVECDSTLKEFMEDVYVPARNESVEEVMAVVNEPTVEEDDDDLFG